MAEHICPVVSRIPGDTTWRVDFDRHYLADFAALNDDDSRSDAAALPASVVAATNIFPDKRVVVCDICAGNDVRRLD